jgi:hypothetical protein
LISRCEVSVGGIEKGTKSGIGGTFINRERI